MGILYIIAYLRGVATHADATPAHICLLKRLEAACTSPSRHGIVKVDLCSVISQCLGLDHWVPWLISNHQTELWKGHTVPIVLYTPGSSPHPPPTLPPLSIPPYPHSSIPPLPPSPLSHPLTPSLHADGTLWLTSLFISGM